MRPIGNITKGDNAVVFGKIKKLKITRAFRKKIPMATGTIEDETGSIEAVWFNQPYIAKMIPEEALVRVEGKVSERKRSTLHAPRYYMSNPKIEKIAEAPQAVGESLFGKGSDIHSLYPVYPESRGITSNWFYHAISKILKGGILDSLEDPIPTEILHRYSLPPLKTALIWIHAPQKANDAMVARKRFAFEEVFFIQIQKQKEKKLWQKEKSFAVEKTESQMAHFTKRFPFNLTEAQNRAIESIAHDFKRGHPMARLLEGDVGSGKTAVAASTSYAIVTSRPEGKDFGNLQTAYMCPTEILAKQQFENFISFFSHLPINIGLITSSGCRKFPSKINPRNATDISRSQLLKWVASGEIPILVGTHSLIQKTVRFKHLAYVIIDEQHRFGVNQRKALVHKEKTVPHLLSMTATPIPRTLALTMYGDLDLTILDQMPPGRKPIITEIVVPHERPNIYEKIRRELSSGRQMYVICPRIDEPDPAKEFAVQAKSAKKEAERLKKEIFPEYEIGVLHSKLSDTEKENTMDKFKQGEISILVSTSVVEVGVNVPNATVIIIEGAERFGLAQLHQLRGRVIRSNHQTYCYVFTESQTKNTLLRLKALGQAKNGFELAEYDLKFRGAGQLSGIKQWGISDIAMEALRNLKMVEAAREEALRIIEEDANLERYPLIKEGMKGDGTPVHFE